MPKKTAKNTVKKPARKKSTTTDGKVRVEIRLEKELYDKLEGIATIAGIAVQQLVHGLAEWGAENSQPGEGYRERGEAAVRVRSQRGCVFLGRRAEGEWEYEIEEDIWVSADHAAAHRGVPEYGQLPQRYVSGDPGAIYGSLDFTPRIARSGD
ncbi:hypothetical protein [Botrimarina colliarenosi]|uniref:hypothetical protein n=1 Tax=Botrimarina colliarenosi TaxID=2528001 RepID=UPI0018D35DBC|nr:hypothetical protein [Botrimarina colliarenosi]